jgi:hypothetical protein
MVDRVEMHVDEMSATPGVSRRVEMKGYQKLDLRG